MPATGATPTRTQGLLDMYTIRHYKKDFSNLTVAIVGDVLHSRVARSDIHGLTTLGCAEVRVVGPRTLVPSNLADGRARIPYARRRASRTPTWSSRCACRTSA